MDVLVTERLELRRPVIGDLADVYAVHADPETSRYNPSGPDADEQASRLRLQGWIADWRERGIGYWTVRAGGVVLGFGGLRFHEVEGDVVLNLYYRFRPAAWGRGYAREMAAAALAAGRERFPDLPIVAVVRDINIPSRKVAEGIGMRFDRTIPYVGVDSHVFVLDPGVRPAPNGANR
ncbi:GNAT family N-acetyltransferase [Microtetraspora glauca]|uniref:GNAT family N-acetyltransferase n=1 Tax=Microtetraspora glauca TaxID=1996 RepID=A0ABV3GCN5_MICGL